MRDLQRWSLLAAFGAMALLAALVLHRPPAASEWATSRACQSCHPDHYESWRRTFHRTMTQEATPGSVLGAFDGRELNYQGITMRPVRTGEQFRFEFQDALGHPIKSLPILRTVGSHRYQQYLTQARDAAGANYYRLPWIWHMGERRWLHANGAFLEPDGQPYDAHVTTWNHNCIFCHNTGPVPGALNLDELEARARRGERIDPDSEAIYNSQVAELGIACEACHGPAARHAEANRSPLRRYELHWSGAADPTIVSPRRLDKERSVELCGQCHGQRLPKPRASLTQWLRTGPPYRAGADLSRLIESIWIETPPPGPEPDLFRKRFWADGTARLSAYEYQGLLQSACYQKGSLTCISCHTMHGGDPAGMIEPLLRTNEACRSCHARILENVSEHTHHPPESSGSQCYECHMPREVYGILEIHRSHRIASPDPARDARLRKPDACTSCHLDRDAAWAAERAQDWWGIAPSAPQERQAIPRSIQDLLAGDPVQRAVAARLAARSDSPLPSEVQTKLMAPALLAALEDRYPAVRWFARLSLLQLFQRQPTPEALLQEIRAFEYLDSEPLRARALERIRGLWNNPGSDSTFQALRQLQPMISIHVGE